MESNYNNYGDYSKQNDQYQEQSHKRESHNHEFQSSADYEKDDEGMEHSHHIAGVTGPAIRYGQSHVHRINTLIDTSGDHYHGISDTTGPALYLNGRKHVHLLRGATTYDDGHKHNYYFTTLIEDPTNVPEEGRC
jgi:hypothetical protein